MIEYSKKDLFKREEEIKLNEIDEIQRNQFGDSEKNASINTKVRNNYSINDELGIHRKVLIKVCELLNVSLDEFVSLCENIEEAKTETTLEYNSRHEAEDELL